MPHAFFRRPSLLLALSPIGFALGCVSAVVCETDEQCVAHDPALRCEQRGEGEEKRCYRAVSDLGIILPPRRCSDTPVAVLKSAQTADAGQRFGSALAAWGGTRLLVGNPGAKSAMIQVGDAVVFDTTNGWQSSSGTSLYTSGALNLLGGAGFGSGVSLSDSTALVTSFNNDNMGVNQLTAYVFSSSGPGSWMKVRELTPTWTMMQNNRLAQGGVMLLGDRALFATQHQEGVTRFSNIREFSVTSGAACVPAISNTTQLGFGQVLATTETRLLIGAQGALYSHQLSGACNELTPVTAPAGGGSAYGSAVAASGSLVAIGAPRNSERVPFYAVDAGSQGWNTNIPQPQQDAMPSDYGKKIALDTDLLAVSDVELSGTTGKVRIYQKLTSPSEWRLLTTLVAPNHSVADATEGAFGAALAVSKDYVFVGAPKSMIKADNSKDGAVFVYSCAP